MAGTIDISKLNTPPEKHELATTRYFADMGKDIIFIEPSNIKEVYRPDIFMDGVEWEIKSPVGKGRRTIEKSFAHAIKQSENIIFDLRRINLQESMCVSQLEKEFSVRKVKRLLVIKKNGEILEVNF